MRKEIIKDLLILKKVLIIDNVNKNIYNYNMNKRTPGARVLVYKM